MVDRQSRDRLAELLRQLCSGAISIDDYDREAIPIAKSSSDLAVRDVYDVSQDLYESDDAPIFMTRFRGRYRMDREERRHMARAIVFLHSNLEYGWPEDVDYPNTHGFALLIVSSLVASCGLFFVLATPVLAICCFAVAAYIFWCARKYASAAHERWKLRQRELGRDHDVWPFHTRRDLNMVLVSPRLLAGR